MQDLLPYNVVIEWDPVTTRFVGDGPVEIIEYQVILDQVNPKRAIPWVDGCASFSPDDRVG